jgi:hypothetical protein
MDPRCPPTTPLDPDSPKGRQVAEKLASTLAELALKVEQRRRAIAGPVEPATNAA